MGDSRPGSQRRHARDVIMKVVGIQVSIGILIAIGLFFFKGWNEAYSALTGALIGVLPSYYLGNRIFSSSDTSATGDLLLKQIYFAEMMKLGFTVTLFLIAIFFIDARFSIVVSVYAAVVAVNWFAMKFADLNEKAVATSTVSTSD